MPEIKILCVKEPWGWLIANGFKDIENRSWTTSYRGELFISTSKAPYPDEENYIKDVEEYFGVKITRDELQYGGIICKVNLVDVVTKSKSKWFEKGDYGFVLENPRRFEFVPIKSARMVFSRNLTVKEVR